MSETQKAEALRKAARQVFLKGLTWGTSGNISCRLSESELLISASGVALGDLEIRDLVRFRGSGLPRGNQDGPRPSVETAMHVALYESRPDVVAVLHASPFHATMVAASTLQPDPHLTTDTSYYLGRIGRVRFEPPGSKELAHAAGVAARNCDALILDNHGALTMGESPEQAVARMEILEILCRMTVYGSLGIPLEAMSAQQVTVMTRSLAAHETI